MMSCWSRWKSSPSKPRQSLQHTLYACGAADGLSAADADLHLGFWQAFGRNDEFHGAALARPQVNPLESAQAANWRVLFHLTTDVELNDFVALAQGCVLRSEEHTSELQSPCNL